MELTNKAGIPLPIYKAITNHQYSGDGEDVYASVTGLLKPPWMWSLERKHRGEIQEDAADRIWAMIGTAVHDAIYNATKDEADFLAEERLSAEIDGKRISGGVDLYRDTDGKRIITDYKVTSVWSVIHQSSLEDWTNQLNLYAWLYRENGFSVDGLSIIAIMRDWVARKARYERDYPNYQVREIRIKLKPHEEVTQWIRDRIKAHESPELCTAEERWEKPTQYAVKRKGAKKALKLHDSLGAALAHVNRINIEPGTPANAEVETRPSTPTRCLQYCRVANFCPYGQLAKQGEQDAQD